LEGLNIVQMQIRIKARDDLAGRFALAMAGGTERNGKFVFAHEGQQQEYKKILRQLEEEENGTSDSGSDTEAKTSARRHYRRKGGNRFE
jgi:hypothetical protein